MIPRSSPVGGCARARPGAAVLGLLALASLAGSRAASAEVNSPLVRAGVAAYEALDYARCVTLLERAEVEALPAEERIVALRTLGSARVALGDEAGAAADFDELLRVAPTLMFDRSVSPKIRRVFEEARVRADLERPRPRATVAAPPAPVAPPPAAPMAPTTTPVPFAIRIEPERLAAGAPATLHLDAPPGSARVDLSTRAAGRPAFRTRTVYPAADGVTPVPLGGDEIAPPALEAFAVALSAAGAEVGRAGSPALPLRFEVTPATTPVYRRGWFWGTLAGVVVVGAGAGIIGGVLAHSDGTLVIGPQ